VIKYKSKGEFIFDSKEVKDLLGDVPMYDAHVLGFLRGYINENLKDVMEAA